MIKHIIFFIVINLFTTLRAGEGIQPYILSGESGKSVSATWSQLVQSFFFSEDQFEIIGQYSPQNDPDKKVLVVTNPTLRGILNRCKPTAGYLGGIRIGITRQGELTYVSYQNPEFWAIAYLQNEYDRERQVITQFSHELKRSLPTLRMHIDLPFGSDQNFTEENIRQYRYNFRAPYFQNAIKVGTFDHFAEAVSSIEKNIEISPSLTEVFSVTIIHGHVRLLGVQLPEEADILLHLDTGDRNHTAALPYELLVIDQEVFILDPKYRLALGFPDLNSKMFSKVKSMGKKIESDIKMLMN